SETEPAEGKTGRPVRPVGTGEDDGHVPFLRIQIRGSHRRGSGLRRPFSSQSPLCEIPSPAHRKGFGCVRVRDEMGTNQAIHRQVDGSFVFPASPLSSGRKNPAGGGDRVHGGKTPFGGHRGASFPGFQRKGKLSGRASGHR